MSAPVRFGLVGYGKGARWFHAPHLVAAAGCELAGVVARSPERRAALREDFPGVPAYGSLGELADAGVDAIAVSTPLDTHVPLVREAVERGLPVLCDKPFAADAAMARATVHLAERAGVPLCVYQNRRWDADFLTVRAVVDSGRLGSVLRLESRMEQYPPDEGYTTTGGGTLLDFGTHVVDQARVLLGPVRSVYAEVHVREDLETFDDAFCLSLVHEGGATSHITGDWTLRGGPGPRFRVHGSEASLVIQHDDDGQTERLLCGATPTSEGAAWGTVPPQRWGSVWRDGVGEPVPAERGAWSELYAGFARALRGEGPLPVDPWDSVAVLEVLDAARVSTAEGRVVTLG